jgi:hypothetical protein
MLKQAIAAIASLAPFALVVAATACGGASSSTSGEDEQGDPQASIAGDGVADEQVASTESELRRVGGGAAAGRGVVAGGRGVVVGGRGVAVGGRGVAVGGRGVVAGGRAVGVRRGWVGGRWAPGWGWSGGRWIVGGGAQYTCVTNLDCVGPLGSGVAICSYDPAVALGYCVAPSW